MRRLTLISVLVLVTGLPALAKMPPFGMEVKSQGDTLRVTVTLEKERNSEVANFDVPHLDGLVGVFPADEIDDGGRPTAVLDGGKVEVPLSRLERGIYQGEVTLEPGRWGVVPFPDVLDVPRVEGFYPKTVIVEVGTQSAGIWPVAGAGVGAAVVWLWHRARREQMST